MSRAADATAGAPAGDGERLADIYRRARTLFERLAEVGDEDVERCPAQAVGKLLASWARAFSQGDAGRLARRLGWDGLEPRRAAAALSAPGPGPPAGAWTGDLARYARRARAIAADGRVGDAASGSRAEIPEAALAELWRPWVEMAAEGLALDAGDDLALLAPEAGVALEDRLRLEVDALSRGAVMELFAAREDEDDATRFVRSLLAEPLAGLYQAYPVLARQTCLICRQWRERSAELLRRLRRDLPALAAELGGGAEPGRVEQIASGLSDRHRDGRQVTRLRFSGGLEVIYPPRPVDAEAALERFLGWCGERGLEPAPAAARVVPRAGYGWMEVVRPAAFDGRAAAAAYYRRGGSLLAVTHLLRARDLHAENLVATTRGPVVVDAEMLLQPVHETLSSGEAGPPRPSADALCLETGLLEAPPGRGREPAEAGGLRAPAGPPPADLSHVVRGGGRVLDAADHAEDLASGFAAAYRFLLDHRAELLDPAGPLAGLAGLEVRLLLRASRDYGRVLHLTVLPRNQRSGLAGSWLHEALLGGLGDFEQRPVLWPLTHDERAALARGDIPWFGVEAGATALHAAHGERVAGHLALSGLAAVRAAVERLSAADLERQLAALRGALTPPAAAPAWELPRRQETTGEGEDGEPWRRWARELGGGLAATLDGEALASMGWDLAEGRLGLALFAAALARAGGAPGLAGWTERVLGPLAGGETPPAPSGLGGHTGLGSMVWALAWTSRLLGRPELAGVAGALAARVDDELIDSDGGFDVAGGAAGAILGLLALAGSTGDEAPLERACRCGDHLLAHQRPAGSRGAAWVNPGGLMQPGWAHGAAGIARALAALAAVSRRRRYLVGALAAIGYERTLFDAARGNWPVLVCDRHGRQRSREWMVAHCRGAPGVALGRLLAPPALRDRALAAELEAALATTAAAPAGNSDDLCCGTFGRSSVLLAAAERAGQEALRRAAVGQARAAAERAAERGGLGLAAPAGVARAGLLRGLAGVGYQLLRLGGTRGLPDVLALESPAEAAGRGGGAADPDRI